MLNREKCRTCLKIVFPHDSALFTDFQKEMLTKCVPKIEIVNTDRICEECSKHLEVSYHFILQCKKVQDKLKRENENKVIVEDASNNEQNTEDKAVVDNLRLQYKLQQIRNSFPKLDITIPLIEHDYEYNFDLTINTIPFMIKRHLNQILSVPAEKDLRLPDMVFDLSTSENKKKRVLFLGINSNEIISCNDCDREFTIERTFRHHKKSCLKRIMWCSICKKFFFKTSTFARHEEFHKKVLCCKISKKHCLDQKNLLAHEDKCVDYTGDFNITKSSNCLCYICGKGFDHKRNLITHKLCHTGPETCRFCNKVFKNKLSCRSHIRREHYKNSKYMCDQCGKVLSTITHLRCHSDTHQENRTKKFKCNVCDTLFFGRSGMHKHYQLKHTYAGSLQHSCDKCNRSFSSSYSLKRHKARHMRDFLYNKTQSSDNNKLIKINTSLTLKNSDSCLKLHLKKLEDTRLPP